MRHPIVFLVGGLAACAPTDKSSGDTGSDRGTSTTTATDAATDTADDTGTGSPASTCVWVGASRLSHPRSLDSGLTLSISCDGDPPDVLTAHVQETDIAFELERTADLGDGVWAYEKPSLPELEELAADTGLSFGVDVSMDNLDEGRAVPVEPLEHLEAARLHFYDVPEAFFDDTAPAPFLGSSEGLLAALWTAAGTPSIDLDGDGTPDAADWMGVGVDDAGWVVLRTCDGATCSDDPGDSPVRVSAEDALITAFVDTTESFTVAEATPGTLHAHTVKPSGGGRPCPPLTRSTSTTDLGLGSTTTVSVLAADTVTGSCDADPDSWHGTTTLLGVGEDETGAEVLFGAGLTPGADAPDWTWSLALDGEWWRGGVAFCEGQAMVLEGTTVLEATTVDPRTGRKGGATKLDGLPPDARAVAMASVDLDRDGKHRVVVATLSDGGEVGLASVDADGSLAQVHDTASFSAPWAESVALHTTDDGKSLQVLLRGETPTGHAAWLATYTTDGSGHDRLASAPDSVVPVVLGARGPVVDAAGPAGVLFSTPGGYGAANAHPDRSLVRLATGRHTVHATASGAVARPTDGERREVAIPLDPATRMWGWDDEDGLYLVGAADPLRGYPQDTLLTVFVGDDGSLGVGVMESVREFQIPEKVVMEKEDDFYGRTDGEPGFTVVWSSPGRGIEVARYPTTVSFTKDGERIVGEQARSSLVSSSPLGVAHPLDPSTELDVAVTAMRKGRAKKRPILPDPRYGHPSSQPVGELDGAVSLAEQSETSHTDDIVAIVPDDSPCGWATAVVTGTSLDWDDATPTVLATSGSDDCSDLAVPVGVLDTSGDGTEWPVLVQVDRDAGTTSVWTVAWDGDQWLSMPRVTLETTEVVDGMVADIDEDGLAEVVLRMRDETRLVLPTDARALVPLDPSGRALAADRRVSADKLAEAHGALEATGRSLVDSEALGLTTAGDVRFRLVGGLASLQCAASDGRGGTPTCVKGSWRSAVAQ